MNKRNMLWLIVILLIISIIINISEVKVTKYVKEECPPCYPTGWNMPKPPNYGVNYSECNRWVELCNSSKEGVK